MSTTVPREMVSCYVRRFGGWTLLREAIAAELGIGIDDVLELEAGGGPPVSLQARTQHGDFRISLDLYMFEDAAQESHRLVIDRGIAPRRIDHERHFESRRHLPQAQRTLEELEWELAEGQLKLAVALDMAQDPGADGFVRYGEWEAGLKAEIARRKKSD